MKAFNTLPMRAESHLKILVMLLAVLAVGLLVFFVADAQADTSSKLIVDNANVLIDALILNARDWGTKIKEVAAWLFWTLATISMTWTFGLMVLRKADIGEFFAELVRFIMFTGFYWWLLDNGPSFAMMVFDSLEQLADKTASGANQMKVGNYLSFLQLAFQVFQHIHAKLISDGTPTLDQMFMMGSVMAIVVMMTQVAMTMALLFLSCYLLAYVGVFLLGFGGARWTSDIAINYYKTVLGLAVQYFVMSLLIGVMGKSLVDIVRQYLLDPQTLDLNIIFMILMISVAFFMLLSKVPPLIAGVISGASLGSSQFSGAAGGGAMGQLSSGALRSGGGAGSMLGGGSSMLGGALGGSALAMSALLSAMRNIAASDGVNIPSIPGLDSSSPGSGGTNSLEANPGNSGIPGAGGTPYENAMGLGTGSAGGGVGAGGSGAGGGSGADSSGKSDDSGGSGGNTAKTGSSDDNNAKPAASGGNAAKPAASGSQSGLAAMTQSAKNAAKAGSPSQFNTPISNQTANVSGASRQGAATQAGQNAVSQDPPASAIAGTSLPGENSTPVDQIDSSSVDHDASSVEPINEEVAAFVNGDNNNLA